MHVWKRVLSSELSASRSSQEAREASLAAAQNKHEADAACSGMCAQGQDRHCGQDRIRQASRRLLCCCAKATHVHHASASASSTIKIWIVLSRFRPPPPPAIKAHQPSSAQCIFAAQAYPDTHTPKTPLAKACNLCTCRSSQTKHSCAQRLASATGHMTCHPPYDLSCPPPLCHRSKLKLKLCSCRILPNLTFAFSLLRVCGTASPGLRCLAHL